jgi:hypothetical protein
VYASLVKTAATISVLMAAGLGRAQVAQAAAVVDVPCSATALSAAMNGAGSGDTLSLAAGCVYNQPDLPSVNINLAIAGNGATLKNSGFAVDFGTLTVSNLNFRKSRIELDETGSATVNDSTFTGNTVTGDGGAIYDNDSAGNLAVNDCSFTGNSATGDGGAIYDNSAGGALGVNGGTFTGNKATRGGAIFNSANGPEKLTDVVIRRNSAIAGGGIYNIATADLASNTISGNHATGQGGGIYNAHASANGVIKATSAIIRRNSAAEGGGIYNAGDIVDLTSSKISANDATDGGGIYSDHAADIVSLTNSKVSANDASQHGGGIYNKAELGAANSPITRNTAGSQHHGL